MNLTIRYLDLSKFSVAVFLIYINWYKEAYSNFSLVLYGSVFLMVLFLVLSRIPINRNPLLIAKTFIWFGIYSFITGLFVSVDLGLFFSSMTTYFEYLIVFLVCIYISNAENNIDWLFKIMVLVAILCAIQTVLFGVSFKNGVIVTTMSTHNNPNSLGMVMLFGLFSLMHSHEKTKSHFLARLCIAILFLYVIVLCGSRKCLISGVFFIAVWFVSFIKNQGESESSLKKYGYILIAILGVCFIAYFYFTQYAYTASFQRMMQLEDGNSTATRMALYKDALSFFLESPIIGIGFDQYRRWSPYGLYSHSTYAEILSCSGIIGTLIFFVPFIYQTFGLLRYYFNSRGSSKKRYEALVLMLAFLIEVFMGVGNIWIYGFLHMEMLLCIFWSYEKMRGMDYVED